MADIIRHLGLGTKVFLRLMILVLGGELGRVTFFHIIHLSLGIINGIKTVLCLAHGYAVVASELVALSEREAESAHVEAGLDVKGKSVFIAACDMPTINRAVVSCLFDKLGSYDAVIPEWENSDMEPLHAVYNTDAVRRYLTEKKGSSLHAMVHSLNTLKIPPEELRKYDPELETFRNVNTLDDLLKMGPEASYQEKHPEKYI